MGEGLAAEAGALRQDNRTFGLMVAERYDLPRSSYFLELWWRQYAPSSQELGTFFLAKSPQSGHRPCSLYKADGDGKGFHAACPTWRRLADSGRKQFSNSSGNAHFGTAKPNWLRNIGPDDAFSNAVGHPLPGGKRVVRQEGSHQLRQVHGQPPRGRKMRSAL